MKKTPGEIIFLAIYWRDTRGKNSPDTRGKNNPKFVCYADDGVAVGVSPQILAFFMGYFLIFLWAISSSLNI